VALTFSHRSVEEALENGVPKAVRASVPSACLWVSQEQGPPVVLQFTAEPRNLQNLQEERPPPAIEDGEPANTRSAQVISVLSLQPFHHSSGCKPRVQLQKNAGKHICKALTCAKQVCRLASMQVCWQGTHDLISRPNFRSSSRCLSCSCFCMSCSRNE